MKKIYITIAMALLLNVTVLAQGWPANYGGVMLQGFFWDSYKSQWDGFETLSCPSGDKYTWATMYEAGWGENDRWEVPNTTWGTLLSSDVKSKITPYIDIIWLPQSGSTVCPANITFTGTSESYNQVDDQKRKYVDRAWHNGGNYRVYEGSTIVNPDCMGFVPVFYFHHGLSLEQDGTPWTYRYYYDGTNYIDYTPMSYFGTETELKNLISTYRAAGTGAVEDVVANHRGGLGTWSGNDMSIDFPSEYYNGELIEWTKDDVCRDDEAFNGWNENDKPNSNNDCGGESGKGPWARDIDHHSPATQAKVRKYLNFLKNDLGYMGFRYDYARGFEPKHYAEYNTAIRPTFSVGEFWGSQDEISSWIKGVYGEDGYQSAAFDFPLQELIRQAFSYNNFRALHNNGGLIFDPKFRRYAITFLDNHDTFKDLPTDNTNRHYQHRVNNNIVEANAFILCMPGTPCLFWPHFMHPEWHDIICKLIKIRRTAGITNESNLWEAELKGNNGIQWRITGDNGELYFQLGDAASKNNPIPEGFSMVWQSTADGNGYRVARVCISSNLADSVENNQKKNLLQGYPVISLKSGTYSTPINVTVSPSIENTTLVYTTNGHDPKLGDNTITSSTDLTFTENTTLKVGVLINGDVPASSIVTRKYLTTSSSNDKINFYVKDDNAPYFYVWYYDNDGKHELNGTWGNGASHGGNQATEQVQVGGINWWHVQIDKPEHPVNLIINWDGSQTPDINDITSDVFYIVNNGNPTNVTNTYLPLIENPTVSIDKATGTYEGSVTATLTASYSGATIVYTTNGNEPSAIEGVQVTGTTTVNFNETGNYTLRAGILKDGQVINEVARSYTINNGTAITGINIYVRVIDSNDAPVLYYWNDNTSATNVNLTFTQNYNGQTWYYHKIENLSTANIIFKHDQEHPDDWSKKTGDITGLVSPGNYYFYYYPNGSGDRYEVAPGLYTKTDEDFVRLYIKSSTPNDYHLWMWSDSGSKFSSWPGSAISALDGPVEIGGEQWYVCPIRKSFTNKKFKFSQNGNSESNNYELNNDMFVVYPDYENVTSNYIGYLTEEEPTTATLPSCATPMSGCQYFYFENSGYVSPYVWGWNNTKVFTGHSWPGEALVEVAGTASNGNIVYRWTYYGDGAPSSLIFSDNGNSQAPAQGAYEFVNGGYYTNSGLQGVVSGNVMTLAEVIKNGTVGETYTISNDLSIAYIHDGKYIFAKDDDGDALNVSRNASGKTVYNSMTGWKYDQSNWIEIILPEGQELGAADTAKFVNKTLLGQTIVGELKDNINPTIEVVARPIPSETKVYNPNTYVVANFMNSSVNNNYYLVTPQAQEYAVIEWAVYQNGKFYMPATSANNYGIFLEGAIAATSGNPYLVTTPLTSNDNGKVFELEVIIKKKTQATAPTGAPSLKVEVNGNDVSEEWEVAVISTKDLTHTAITDVNVDGNRELVRTRYVNLMGIESDRPFKGANIVVKEYSDGTRTATKMLKR